MLLPLSISYIGCHRAATAQTTKTKMVLMELPLFLCFAVIGLIIGANTVFYVYSSSRLPISTSSLILASQLAFNVVFSFFLVKQKFRAYSVNAVFLLTLVAVVLSLRSNAPYNTKPQVLLTVPHKPKKKKKK
ncbi:hypothetical protein RIF29_25060 [Crotalaria pallida]|uniref:Uncharacterized protein n=1 Tax=Crotalaria pallida TaxID=3830 RepID=A0AAN9ELF8_CROPI